MPLNIDWQQILLHLLNLVILFCILYFLLYSPVKKFMKKREDYYKNMDEDANKKLEDASALKNEYEEKLSKSDEEISLKEKEAMDSLNEEISIQHLEAKKQAEDIINSAKEKSLKEREEIVKKAQQDIQDIATSMAEKIVKGETSDKFDEFLDEAKKKDE